MNSRTRSRPPRRARLVAALRLEVVPGLRQLPVALELARVEGERLLVRQRQDEVTPGAVVDVEELREFRAAGLPPTARPA